MNRDDILRMGLFARLLSPPPEGHEWAATLPDYDYIERLQAFARLAANEERAACLEIISKIERRKWEILRDGGKMTGAGLHDAFVEIRARGEK